MRGRSVVCGIACGVVLAATVPAVASAAPFGVEADEAGSVAPGISAFAQDDRGHQLTISYTNGAYVFHDPAGVRALRGSCSRVDNETVSCQDIGFQELFVDAGDRGDDIALSSLPATIFSHISGNGGADLLLGSGQKDQLLGGPGRDRLNGRDGPDGLYGGPGGDVIKGGPGADTMFGGSGVDGVLARDGERDAHIACQSGANGRELATVDRIDPRAVSC
jgi:Ca2+-binding RTX toxin-like protein